MTTEKKFPLNSYHGTPEFNIVRYSIPHSRIIESYWDDYVWFEQRIDIVDSFDRIELDKLAIQVAEYSEIFKDGKGWLEMNKEHGYYDEVYVHYSIQGWKKRTPEEDERYLLAVEQNRAAEEKRVAKETRDKELARKAKEAKDKKEYERLKKKFGHAE